MPSNFPQSIGEITYSNTGTIISIPSTNLPLVNPRPNIVSIQVRAIGEIEELGEISLNNSSAPAYSQTPLQQEGSTNKLGAQVANVKNLDRLLRILNVLRKSENIPEIPQEASDRDILEYCLQKLEELGLIFKEEDADGNIVIYIRDSAIYHENKAVARLVETIRKWVIDTEGGVKAINFQGKDGKWVIVGFYRELIDDKETLEHERLEVRYRKQGLNWIEAHNRTVEELEIGRNKMITPEKLLEISEIALREGRIVLIGDKHWGGGAKEQHALFINLLRELIKREVKFALALELPYQLELDSEESTTEEILEKYINILSLARKVRHQGVRGLIVPYMREIIGIAKAHNIPLIFVDDGKVKGFVTREDLLGEAKNIDEWMAKRLQEGKAKHGSLGILGMIGAAHIKSTAIPSYFSKEQAPISVNLDRNYGGLYDYLLEVNLTEEQAAREFGTDKLIDPEKAQQYRAGSRDGLGANSSSPQNFIAWMSQELFIRLKDRGISFSGVVLDVGTRDGRYIESIRNLGAGEVYGIEPDKGALDEAVRSGRLDKEHAIGLRLEDWNREAESVDSIVVLNFIIPITERDSFLKRALEILKREGTLLISCAEKITYQDVRRRLLSLNIRILNEGILFPEFSGDGPNKYYLYVKKIEDQPAVGNIGNSPLTRRTDREMGGIDFRHLPIVTQAITNLSANINSSDINNLLSINLDGEWQQIVRMVSSGVIPSSERIKQYIQTSCAQDSIIQDRDKILLCLSDILRLEEERCSHINPTLKDILVMLESINSAQEFKEVFLGKKI